jgi:hypothetical protein
MPGKPRPKGAKPGSRVRPEREAKKAAGLTARGTEPVNKPNVQITDDLMKEICSRMADGGESLKDICSGPDMPTPSAVNQFCWRHPIWHDLYEAAKVRRHEGMLERAVDAVSDRSRDDGPSGYTAVARDKLIADTMLRAAAMAVPRLRSNHIEAKVQGAVTLELKQATDAERLEAIRELMKASGGKLPAPALIDVTPSTPALIEAKPDELAEISGFKPGQKPRVGF